jgi:hypothetical protein
MPEFPEIRITRDELVSISRLPGAEVFPALRRVAQSRGIIYHGDCLKFKTRRDKTGNLYLQNYIEAPDRSLCP